jgi:hypothetical protein
MRIMVCVTCCILSLAVPLLSQAQRGEPLVQPSGPLYQHPVVVARPYQQTWYGALLRQFNPDNLDRGQWLEQRRQAFLEQTGARIQARTAHSVRPAAMSRLRQVSASSGRPSASVKSHDTPK